MEENNRQGLNMREETTLFSALSDGIRLRCLALLAAAGELCVCQMVHALDVPQPKVSKHLAVLREARLIEQRRVAQWVLYRLAPQSGWQAQVLSGALAGVAAKAEAKRDCARLAGAPQGPPGAGCHTSGA